MPFGAREGRAGSKAVGRRREEPSWTSESEVSTGTPGAGRRAPGQDGWKSTEEVPKGPQPQGGNGSRHWAPSLAYSRCSGQTSPLLSQSPEFQRRDASVGVGPELGLRVSAGGVFPAT